MIRSRLFWQIAIALSLLIFLVQGGVVYTAVEGKEQELLELRRHLDADALRETGRTFNELHPDVLDDQDIERRLDIYRMELSARTLVLAAAVLLVMLGVLYFVALRPLYGLIAAIRGSSGSEMRRFDGRRPANEIGELIDARDRQLDLIDDYQRRLEDRVDALRDEIRQSEKLRVLGEISAGVVHDLNNPLQIMMISLETLREQARRQSFHDPGLTEALDAGDRATRSIRVLVTRLMRFLRGSPDRAEEFRLRDVVEEALGLLEARLARRGVQLVIRVSPELRMRGYPLQLEQALLNLLGNAADALEGVAESRVEVSARIDAGWVRLEVSDNGPGIPEEIRDQIFESFFTTKPAGSGTGLGLVNVRRMVEQHGGQLVLESEAGRGSTFLMWLPLDVSLVATSARPA